MNVIEANEHPVPLRRKPGRWVPPILFLIWLAITAVFPTMLLWCFIFVPVALVGWHFGMGKRKNNSTDGLSATTQVISSLTGNSPHIHP